MNQATLSLILAAVACTAVVIGLRREFRLAPIRRAERLRAERLAQQREAFERLAAATVGVRIAFAAVGVAASKAAESMKQMESAADLSKVRTGLAAMRSPYPTSGHQKGQP